MKILITGGCGFAGSHVIEHVLKNTDWEIVIFDKLTYAASGLDRMREIRALDNNRVFLFSVDITRPLSIGIIKECKNVDYILHMAAATHVDKSIKDPRSFVYSNVVGTYNILEFAKQCESLKAFCYFSTDEVFGPAPEGVLFKEWDRYNCTNPYCLLPNTKIPLYNGNMKYIKDINIGDEVISFNEKSNTTVKGIVSNKFQYKTDIINIKTDINDIGCSKNHKFLVKQVKRWKGNRLANSNVSMKWLSADNLKKGDWIAYIKKNDIISIPSIYDSKKEFVKFLGYYCGDGYIKKSKNLKNNYIQYTILLGDVNKKRVEYYNNFLPNKGCVYKHKTKNCWYTQTGSIDIVKEIMDTPLYNKAKDKFVPNDILLGSEEIISNFIGGLFDADGSVSGHIINICSFSKKLLEQLSFMLFRLGIQNTIDYRWKKIIISDTYSYNRFVDIIPTFKKIKKSKSKIQRTFLENENIIWRTIREIKYRKKHVVYDIEINNYHNYLIHGNMLSHNSATKAGAEQLVLSYMNCYGLPGFVVNCMNLFGEMQHPEKFIPLCIRKILVEELIEIHGTPDGKKSGSRFYIHARNMAGAVIWLLDKFTQRDKYNIVGEREFTNLEVAQIVANVLGKKLKYKIVNYHTSRPGHDLRYALDGSKLLKMGYEIPVTIEESLKKTILWTLTHPKWLEIGG